MAYSLSPNELRVLGALIEKQITTPDQYPLTLKALVGACNQKSNREPVLNLAEQLVDDTLTALEKEYLVSRRTEYGSRVTKHRQRFCNTEFGTLQFTPGELAIVCSLMLRGPQTPGELRSRTARMHPFADVAEVDTTLDELMTREDGPFAARLPREPGRRESRYAHLLGDDEPDIETAAEPAAAARPPAERGDRVSRLEKSVTELEGKLAALEAIVAKLAGP